MQRRTFLPVIVIAVTLAAWVLTTATARAASDADEAQITFNSFMRDKDFSYLHL